MAGKLMQIGLDTVLPIGMVIALIAVSWTASSNVTKAQCDIKTNAKDIATNKTEIDKQAAKLDYLTHAMVRVETKLGTLPSNVNVQTP